MIRNLFAIAAALVIVTTAAIVGAEQSGNGNVDGAIFTTTATGTVVNENTRYGSKAEVYLNGGPQNHQANGLPDGFYYFQITNPSGDLLLSTEDIKCRVLVVSGGRVSGVPVDDAGGYGDASCYHNVGAFNPDNGSTPVQMCAASGCPGALPGGAASYYDTDNPGGEYKAWITPVTEYDAANTSCTSNNRFGFCDSHSKTDNFKIRQAASRSADITVCKFNDVNGNGAQDQDENFIEHWPISAAFGDTVVNGQTLDDGCVTFTFTDFATADSSQVVTLSESTFGDWTQTAPADGEIGAFTVSGGAITTTLHPGDEVTAPAFGNTNPYCDNCGIDTLVVTKTAFPGYKRTYEWTIEKAVDQTEIKTSAGATATFNYTVTVTHDEGTDSGWAASGKITVANPSLTAVTVNVTDAVDNGGACAVVDGTNVTLAAGSHQDFDYTCTYDSLPADGVNTATATADGIGAFTGTAAVKFSTVSPAISNGSVTVTDSLTGGLGTVSAADASPQAFSYAYSVAAPSGTCIDVNNTATFSAVDGPATGDDSQAVKVCGALPLEIAKTATAASTPAIDKAVVGSALLQTANSAGSFNYNVTVTNSGWAVTGAITITNPNDWQSVSVEIADAIDNGGNCQVTGGGSVGSGETITATYTCSYSGAPSLNAGTNTAVATWDAVAAYTATGSATATAAYDFGTLTVTDTFNGGAAVTLGTINGSEASKTFTYSQTVNNAIGGSCLTYPNVASAGSVSDSASVTICNTATGGLTMGFWQNRNGQTIIKAANQAALGAYLDGFVPFQDRGTTVAATYITNVIKAANASGASMNAMLKGQMLATALDVYFSDAALGGNVIGAPQPIGGVNIDLTMVCTDLTCTAYENAAPGFGGASSMKVSELLLYASGQSTVGGSTWYANVKALQELAKDTFDVINNKLAWIAP